MTLALLLALAGAPPPTAVAADTLDLARAIALGRDRGVAAALARIDTRIAEARVGERRADLLPAVSFTGALNRRTLNLDEFGLPFATGVTDPFNLFSFQAHASQTLFDAAAFTRLRTAKDSVVAAGYDAQTAGVLAGTTAGIAFLRALSAEETVRAREADSVIALRLLELARELNQAGLTAAIDLTRSEVNAAVIRSQLSQARNARERSRLDLARALDFPPDTALQLAALPDRAADLIPRDPDSAVAFALAHRPELAAERRRLAALEGTRRAIAAERLPSLVASGTYTESGRSTGSLAGSYFAQLGIAIPLFDGLHRERRLEEQGLRIEAERIRVRDSERRIDAEARQALLDLATATEQVTLASERQRLAEQELTQAEERFQAGVAGSIETTNAQTGLVAARDQVIQARVGLAIARVGTYRALGILEQLP